MNDILQYRDVNRIAFALGKIEAIHFTNGREATNPPIQLRGGITIQPVPLRDEEDPGSRHSPPALRWLGVHFDRKLKFRRHVEIKAEQATTLLFKGFAISLGKIPVADQLVNIFSCVRASRRARFQASMNSDLDAESVISS